MGTKTALQTLRGLGRYYAAPRCTIKRIDAFDYVVATKRGLYLASPGSVELLLPGQFYGISLFDDAIYVFQSIVSIKRGRILRIERDGKVRKILRGLPLGCHQIDFFGDQLFVADTYNNCIQTLDARSLRTIEKAYPLGRLEHGRASQNYGHINSVFCTDDRRFLLCHNETTKTGRASQILVCDRNFEIVERIDTQAGNAHNIAPFRGSLLYCDSNNRTLTDGHTTYAEFELFTRGLSISDDMFVVGESEYASREQRTKKAGWLNYFDPSWRLIERQKIPGMVLEIRALHKPDYGLSNAQRSTSVSAGTFTAPGFN